MNSSDHNDKRLNSESPLRRVLIDNENEYIKQDGDGDFFKTKYEELFRDF